MFEDYVHTKEDLEAVEEALGYLERPELDFIFEDRSLIKNTLVISFDSEELLIWTKLKTSKLGKLPCNLKGWNAYQIPHKIKIEDKDQKGWSAGLRLKEAHELLPEEFQKNWDEIPNISGSLFTPFVGIHKMLRAETWKTDPYYTRESYLVTIIHEFGHVYFNRYVSKHGPREKLSKLIRDALAAYKGESVNFEGDSLHLPPFGLLTETFAFCTDYCAASIFWPDHKKDIDTDNREKLEQLTKDGNIDFIHESHAFAGVFGKLAIEKYPKDWPGRLLDFS